MFLRVRGYPSLILPDNFGVRGGRPGSISGASGLFCVVLFPRLYSLDFGYISEHHVKDLQDKNLKNVVTETWGGKTPFRQTPETVEHGKQFINASELGGNHFLRTEHQTQVSYNIYRLTSIIP